MSSTPAPPLAAPLDVFGPSNPLYPLVLLHLPDVLTRIVVHYASPLFPRQGQYAGNAVLGSGCHTAFNTRTAALIARSTAGSDESSLNPALSSARPFSLSAALTVCGWMCRPRADKAAILLSANSNVADAPRSSCMFLGYVNHPNTHQLHLGARFAADSFLSAPPSTVHTTADRDWEHVAFTFQPQPATEEQNGQLDEEDDAEEEPTSGTRRLYHNGALVAQDDCPPLPLQSDFYLVLGRCDMRLMSPCVQGGLCDVRVYSRALDADEVQRLYEGEEVSGEQLEVRWRLDVSQLGEDRYVRDSSGHGRHAVVPGHPIEISKTGSAGGESETAEQGGDGDVDAANDMVVQQSSPSLLSTRWCARHSSCRINH